VHQGMVTNPWVENGDSKIAPSAAALHWWRSATGTGIDQAWFWKGLGLPHQCDGLGNELICWLFAVALQSSAHGNDQSVVGARHDAYRTFMSRNWANPNRLSVLSIETANVRRGIAAVDEAGSW